MTLTTRKSICRVFLAVSIVMLIAIGFVATPPPKRIPLFVVNAGLTIPVIVLGSKWQRIFACAMLAIVLYLAEEEFSAGKDNMGW